MKKILSILLIVILICLSLAFAGCANGSNYTSSSTKSTPAPTPYRNSNIVSYMKANEEKVYREICAKYKKPYTGSYEINGDNLIVKIKTEQWGKYSEDRAEILQALNGIDSSLEFSFYKYYEQLKKEIPGINSFEVYVYDMEENFFFKLPESRWKK